MLLLKLILIILLCLVNQSAALASTKSHCTGDCVSMLIDYCLTLVEAKRCCASQSPTQRFKPGPPESPKKKVIGDCMPVESEKLETEVIHPAGSNGNSVVNGGKSMIQFLMLLVVLLYAQRLNS
jgi:hypothetical protein